MKTKALLVIIKKNLSITHCCLFKNILLQKPIQVGSPGVLEFLGLVQTTWQSLVWIPISQFCVCLAINHANLGLATLVLLTHLTF